MIQDIYLDLIINRMKMFFFFCDLLYIVIIENFYNIINFSDLNRKFIAFYFVYKFSLLFPFLLIEEVGL